MVSENPEPFLVRCPGSKRMEAALYLSPIVTRITGLYKHGEEFVLATNLGLYRSTDRCRTWNQSGVSLPVEALAFPNDGKLLAIASLSSEGNIVPALLERSVP